jgi:hypothetical protein
MDLGLRGRVAIVCGSTAGLGESGGRGLCGGGCAWGCVFARQWASRAGLP